MIIVERIAPPFEVSLFFLNLASVWEVCLGLIKYVVLMTGNLVCAKAGSI